MLLVSVLIMLLAFISSFYEFTSHQLQLSLAAPYNHSTFFLHQNKIKRYFFRLHQKHDGTWDYNITSSPLNRGGFLKLHVLAVKPFSKLNQIIWLRNEKFNTSNWDNFSQVQFIYFVTKINCCFLDNQFRVTNSKLRVTVTFFRPLCLKVL